MAHAISPERVAGHEAVVLRSRTDDLHATFLPALGMVGTSLVHRGEELLGRHDRLQAYAEDGAVMGIPLLHPWANRLEGERYPVSGRCVELPAGSPLVHREEHGLPIHGLMAASPHWHVASVAASGCGVTLSAVHDFAAHADLLEAFPFPHRLALDVTLARRTLTVRLTVTATGSDPVPIAFGFHPYLRLPGADRADWRVRLPACRRLVLDERRIPTGATEPFLGFDGPLGGRTFDDGFVALPAVPTFTLSGGGREIAVTFLDGYPAAQVFAPADEDVVCFEPMTAPTNALGGGHGLTLLAPAASYSAAFAIRVAG